MDINNKILLATVIVNGVIGIISVIVNIVIAKIANKFASMANTIQLGQSELQMRATISAARKNFSDIVLKLGNLKDDTRDSILKAAREEVMNAYDEACMKYLDGKTDKTRFKKAYDNEIRQLVEDENNKDKYGNTTKYEATLKVYNEWNKHE